MHFLEIQFATLHLLDRIHFLIKGHLDQGAGNGPKAVKH